MLKKLLLLSTLAFYTITYAHEPIIFNSPAQKIVVSQRLPIFTITLKSNPTTGYSWNWIRTKEATNMFTLISHHFFPPQNKHLVGAPGYEIWTFKAKKTGYRVAQVAHIKMEYARPWEKNKKDSHVEIFTVVQSEARGGSPSAKVHPHYVRDER